ncbi:MAG: CDP-alcohol phosphatidyltransferase family protein [Promethearchaeota archaeon]
MPSKFRLRYIFRPLINQLAKALIKIRITPNKATIIMFCFSIISFITLVYFRNLLFFSISVFITGIMDGCDGAIARLNNKTTKFGGFFDSFMDRTSEFFIFLGLYIYTQDQLLWNFIDMNLIILISFLASIMISYTRARAEVFFNGDFDIGLMARSERLFYIVIISVVSFFYDLFNLFLFIFMWLTLGTYLFRMIKIYFIIKKKEAF